MAFTLQAIVGSTTVNLSNGNPFKLLSATGMGGAPVRRVSARGPAQQGDTDLGYRLQAREIELEIGFHATTDAILDGYRDTLTSIFKPTASTPVQLRVTRDDGEVRALDCYTVGVLRIDLVPDHRPGHYHVATVRLRAPEPSYYAPTALSGTLTGTVSSGSVWWTGGGTVGTAQVMEYGEYPAQGQPWTYMGTPGTAGYTIAFRTSPEEMTPAGKYMFFAGDTSGSPAIAIATRDSTYYEASPGYETPPVYETSFVNLRPAQGFLIAGTNSYFLTYDPNAYSGGLDLYGLMDVERARSGTTTTQVSNNYYGMNFGMSGAARRWRSDGNNTPTSRWQTNITHYAVYVPPLNTEQMRVVAEYMAAGSATENARALNVAYGGDLPEYPVLELRGPVSNPTISNASTGAVLDFGTINIPSGTVYTIDLRPGYKTITAGGIDKRGELTSASDLETFHLAPEPVVTGGTNVLFLGGTGHTSTTRLVATYYNRYMSF